MIIYWNKGRARTTKPVNSKPSTLERTVSATLSNRRVETNQLKTLKKSQHYDGTTIGYLDKFKTSFRPYHKIVQTDNQDTKTKNNNNNKNTGVKKKI